MKITGFIWLEEFEDKILRKHGGDARRGGAGLF